MSQGFAADNEGIIALNWSSVGAKGEKDSSSKFRIFVLLLGNDLCRVVGSVDGISVVLGSGNAILSFWL